MSLTRINISLMAKWWFRFKDPTIEGKWKAILINKYGTSGLDSTNSSHFWNGLLSFQHIFELGINRQVNNGQDTALWLDRWHGECALYCRYPNLFKIVADPTITVSNAYSTSYLSLTFNRQLTGISLSEWQDMQTSISFHSIPDTSDLVSWRWASSGKFIVHSLYMWLEF